MNTRRQLETRLAAALRQAGGAGDAPAMVAPAGRPEFGDYQANGVMALAKRLKINPRELAEATIAAADLGDMVEKLDLAGPGFINITLKSDWLARQLAAHLADEKLGVEPPETPRTVVVDYSHPNLAKEMHVGHLRSTIIGDALVRVLAFLGHRVVRHNHVGDWGTQFGMLVAHMDDLSGRGEADLSARLSDLEEFYVAAKKRFDDEPDFAQRSREYVVRLQGGDAHCVEVWRAFIAESMAHCQGVYDRLGVTLTPEDVRPESAYNDDLPKVVADLRAAGLLRESEGAQCVFLDEFTNRDGEPLPAIVQKSDGGYLYLTTDLAAARYRVNVVGADRILYIVDARQTLHLRQLFAVARAATFVPEACSLEHHPFGTMMGDDGRPFKTRSGGTIKLMDLLAESEQRAMEVVAANSGDLPAEEQRQIAHAVGIGAVKYADLCQNRTSDYVFNFEKMLSLDGNSAPYMQYAHARARSICRKGGVARDGAGRAAPSVDDRFERALGLKLLQLPEAVQAVADECLPNLLCAYLYDVATAFSGFFENCPVLTSDEPLRSQRLAMCDLTARVIATGMDLLGIETPERM